MTSAILNPHSFPETGAPTATVRLESIEVLHSLYSQRIFRFVFTSVRDRELAEQITQDTFLRAWTAREQFRGDCSPATWLTRIALNLVRDHTRTGRFKFWQTVGRTSVDATEFASFIPDPVTSAESALIAQQQVGEIWKTVAELSERQRTVFLLRFVEELELVDIAEITGMPMSTVKTHLYRGLAIVRARHQKTSGKDSK